MKAKLLIVCLLITGLTYSQSKNKPAVPQNSSSKKNSQIKKSSTKEINVKNIDTTKDTSIKATKRTIKIGGTEKPYTRGTSKKGDSSGSTSRFYNKRKLSEEPLKKNSTNRKRRVEVLKSNKEGDPKKKN
jgi:hypothetical protein